MLRNLFIRLWNDEDGAVIATEYLMLGSVVAVGSASGMVAMRDTVIDEYKELGNNIRQVRQNYGMPPARPATVPTAAPQAVPAYTFTQP